MSKNLSKSRIIKTVILLMLIVAVVLAVPIMCVVRKRNARAESGGAMINITVWQIDGFEGGKGSRASYLQNIAKKCFDGKKTYINVTALSAGAARENLKKGVVPDMISYPAGFYGIENLINRSDFTYRTWARGGYCLISLDENADFSDVNTENTVINEGKDNLTCIAASLCGLNGADYESPTNAYLRLLGGNYKYLLGTQRDAFRLKTRNAAFRLKPIEQFNDLYQNISVLTTDGEKYERCKEFTDYLLRRKGVGALGLFCADCDTEMEQLAQMRDTRFETTLTCPCGKDYIDELKAAAQSADVNKIKTLLK